MSEAHEEIKVQAMLQPAAPVSVAATALQQNEDLVKDMPAMIPDDSLLLPACYCLPGLHPSCACFVLAWGLSLLTTYPWAVLP